MRRNRNDIVMVNGMPVEVPRAEDVMCPEPMSDRESEILCRRLMGRFF